MNTDTSYQHASNQPLANWAQLTVIFVLPGVFQGLAFYLIADGLDNATLSGRAFALWFLAIAPTCVFLISIPGDRWRSVAVAAVTAFALSALFYTNAQDAAGPEGSVPPGVVALSMVCSLVIILTLLPFYRTRWQRSLPFSHYVSLFEFAWNQAVCLLIGVAFTGLVAGLVGLSVALFKTVGLSLEELAFDSPLAGAWAGGAFATAIGITRQSESIVLGARVLLLALLRTLLPVMLLISAFFVVLVGVVGVDELDTGLSIALIVLTAATTAIVLVSARIGDAQEELTRLQQVLTRGLAAVVLPLAMLAVHALWFRIVQHGWTGDRVIAAVIISLCVLYGLGYLLGAMTHPRVWIPRVNRWMAGVCAVAALFLMTPWLDPDRIGVRDQMVRFNDGRTSGEQLDLGYLKFGSGRVGRVALEHLASRPEGNAPPLDTRLAQLAKVTSRYDLAPAGVSKQQRESVSQVVRDGTLRILLEDETGWHLRTDLDETSEQAIGMSMSRSFYEFTEYCISNAQDCAYIKSGSEAAMLAVRVADSELLFYLQPESVFLPGTEAGVGLLPTYPQLHAAIGADQGLAPADIDDWFATLDQGLLPSDVVEVPALVIGPYRVLRRGALDHSGQVPGERGE